MFAIRTAKAAKCRAILFKSFHYVTVVVVGLLLSGLTSLVTLAMLAAYTASLFA